MIALQALYLAAALASTPPHLAGARVHRVTLDLPQGEAERLKRYLTVREGDPWDPSSVRRTVELLFATGEFADVIADVRAAPEGLEVTFRPSPSPRLLEVRVEGDTVRSPAKLRNLARLRPGEALWPDRTFTASREVTRDLVAAGYLEAQVTAEARPVADPFRGADLVFHLQTGPRARVARLALDGASSPEQTLLAGLGQPRPGEPFVRERAEKAAQSMRRRLVAAGRWGASVEVRDIYDPSSAQVDLIFAVSAGPVVVLETRGASFSRALLREVEQILREGGLRRDAQEAGGERLEAELRRLGHRDALVQVREEPRAAEVAVVYEVKPGPAATVSQVRVEDFVGDVPALATRVGLPLEEATLQGDVRALTRSLEEGGYADARVESLVPEGGGELGVVFRARPGPRSVLESFAVDSPLELPGTESRIELRGRAGQPYRVRELAADRSALLSTYRDAGYLDVAVTPDVTFSDDRTAARVRLRVEPGSRTDVAAVVVSGLRRTREQAVRRELALEEGKPLGLSDLLESQKRLGALGIFERVSLTEVAAGVGQRSVVVTVDEAPRTTVSYGIGYSERELLRGSVEVTRRNLGGLDRTLTAYARGSFRGSRFVLGYREPYLFGRKRDLYLAAFREEEERTGFGFNRTGVLAQTVTRLGDHTSLSVRYTFQDTRVFDLQIPLDEVDREFRTYTLSGPSLSIVDDRRDDPLEPRRGIFLGADVQSSFRFLGGARFLKGFLQAATYHQVKTRLTVAISGRLGLARTFGVGEPHLLPLPERFFAGGDYGPRGFKTDFAGPLELGSSGEPVPTGGSALVFGGLELRYDLRRTLALAAFTDAGSVYPRVSNLDLAQIFYTTGLGLRYQTPVGPVRVDWGYKLNRRPGEGPYRVHVTIGNAF